MGAHSVLSANPHGLGKAKSQLKKLVKAFYDALPKDCQADAKALKAKLDAETDSKKKNKLFVAFDKKCILYSMERAKKEVEALLQLGGEHDSFFLSVFIGNFINMFGR